MSGNEPLTWQLWAAGIETSEMPGTAGRAILRDAVDRVEATLGSEWLETHRHHVHQRGSYPAADCRSRHLQLTRAGDTMAIEVKTFTLDEVMRSAY